MKWASRFRAGDLVEVCSEEEILATLDEEGCVDGMPFMPEMLQFCGRQFRVRAVAHKTCDTIERPRGRRVNSTVHLLDVNCDGSAHGGCQAGCNLFWKDVWLKPPAQMAGRGLPVNARRDGSQRRDKQWLVAKACRSYPEAESGPIYVCQSTNLLKASANLRWWDLRQYLLDITTGNRSLGCVLRALGLAFLSRVIRRSPVGYRALTALYGGVHHALTGRPSPAVQGRLRSGTPTPTSVLSLRPGELVRIKSKDEIEATLDESGKNRGLSFDKEMAPYCGGVFKVLRAIESIVDERTGKMLRMKQPCIVLENVACKGEYSECRLMCPREIPSYWREIWLDRVGANGRHEAMPEDAALLGTAEASR